MGADAARVRVVILDFDGVVIESNAVKAEAFAEVFARFPAHASAMMGYHHENVSASRFVKFEELAARLGRPGDAALIADLASHFARSTQDRLCAVPLVEGAASFLSEFSARVPLYLASVTPAKELDEILERRNLGRFFKAVFGCPPWTKASAVREILRREGLPAREAVLVGDSTGDRRAAEETGVEFVGRDSGLGFDAPAPTLFRDLKEVGQFLRPRIE